MNAIQISDMIDVLVEMGATPQQIAEAVRKQADKEMERAERVRADARIRKQRQRARQKETDVENIEETSRVTCVTKTNKEIPPTPPKENKKNNPPIVPPRGDGSLTEFEELWKAWSAKLPKPRGQGKAKTQKLFSLKAKSTEPSTIVAAAKSYLTTVEGNDLQFIPGLSVWLNQERYDTGENVVAMAKAVDWEQAVLLWSRREYWPERLGPKPNEAGCQCPPELLKQGALI